MPKETSVPPPLETIESDSIRILAKLHLCGAFSEEKAREADHVLSEEEKKLVPALVEEGFLALTPGGKLFLTTNGITWGAVGLRHVFESKNDEFAKWMGTFPELEWFCRPTLKCYLISVADMFNHYVLKHSFYGVCHRLGTSKWWE